MIQVHNSWKEKYIDIDKRLLWNSKITPQARFLYLMLQCYDGEECPSKETLAATMGCCLATLRKYYNELKSRGYLKIKNGEMILTNKL